MILLWPWSLLGILVVVAVALWALLRPARAVAIVGSLALWREALDSLDRSGLRRRRRVTWAWAALLAGALLGVLAAARPVLWARRPARQVAIALYPCAELAGEAGRAELGRAVGALLDRLDADDRVELVLPTVLGGSSGWLSPMEARRRIGFIEPLPVPAARLSVPSAVSDAQHTYTFAPAGVGQPVGPDVTLIELPDSLPPVTIDALGAADLADGHVRVFVAARNNTAEPRNARLSIRRYGADGTPLGVESSGELAIPPGRRREAFLTIPPAAAIAVDVAADGPEGSSLGAVGYLAAGRQGVGKVAMIGADCPPVRRFIRVAPWLELAGGVESADVVIANRTDPPATLGALVIDPTRSPPGWRRSDEVFSAALGEADVASDDPVMRDVDLSAVAVRRLRPWVATARDVQERLVTLGGDAVVLRSVPQANSGAPRRVHVAFGLEAANTNFSATEAFVIFMANTMRWLVPAADIQDRWGFAAPLQAGRAADHRRLAGQARADGEALLSPGIYLNAAGVLHAVSLTGLRAGAPNRSPGRAIADAPLPGPKRLPGGLALWPVLLAAATGAWLAGWALRGAGL